jgi:hypothetical protein
MCADLGFIIGRCIRNENHIDLCFRCFQSIRKFYPIAKVLIIDDNSCVKDTHIYDQNTYIFDSTYHGRGEYGLYYYYYKLRPFERAVMLHDSMIIHKKLIIPDQDVIYLWHFEPERWEHETMMEMYKIILDHELFNPYLHNTLYSCFGICSIIKLSFLDRLVGETTFLTWLDVVDTRKKRCAMERIFAMYCEKVNAFNNDLPRSLCGDIIPYQNMDPTHNETDSPIIKTWHGR